MSNYYQELVRIAQALERTNELCQRSLDVHVRLLDLRDRESAIRERRWLVSVRKVHEEGCASIGSSDPCQCPVETTETRQP